MRFILGFLAAIWIGFFGHFSVAAQVDQDSFLRSIRSNESELNQAFRATEQVLVNKGYKLTTGSLRQWVAVPAGQDTPAKYQFRFLVFFKKPFEINMLGKGTVAGKYVVEVQLSGSFSLDREKQPAHVVVERMDIRRDADFSLGSKGGSSSGGD